MKWWWYFLFGSNVCCASKYILDYKEFGTIDHPIMLTWSIFAALTCVYYIKEPT